MQGAVGISKHSQRRLTEVVNNKRFPPSFPPPATPGPSLPLSLSLSHFLSLSLHFHTNLLSRRSTLRFHRAGRPPSTKSAGNDATPQRWRYEKQSYSRLPPCLPQIPPTHVSCISYGFLPGQAPWERS